jgi:phage-related tail protein
MLNMNDEKKSEELSRIESRDGTEVALEITAAFAGAAPWVGNAISNYLTGRATDRKFHRIAEELKRLAEDMKRVESETAKQYVRTDEFEDLLDLTMRKIADERSEAKRKMYRAFLANTAASPGEPWAEKQRMLRTLEEVEPEHVRLLKALIQEPRHDLAPMALGSVFSTIRERAPEIIGRLDELVRDLDRMGLANVGVTGGMMTGYGAQDLRGRVTSYGQRFVRYVMTE